jgi:hypothetical protein
VIVLHEAEGPPNHGVLKVRGRFQSGNFACEVLPYAEVPGSPSNTLSYANQSGSNSGPGYSHFTRVQISGQMHFDASREVKAAFNWRPYDCELLQGHHKTQGYSEIEVKSTR